jgi:predicted metallo-beta-lactamase superfamily hydrolase
LRRNELRGKLEEYAKAADVITISHYHYDHYSPAFNEHALIGSTIENAEKLYKDKVMLIKDFRSHVNPSQRRRGWLTSRIFKKFASRVEPADNNTFVFGGTTISFSQPVPHGEENSGLGWVLMMEVKDRDSSFLFASDVQGPMAPNTVEKILSFNPDILFIGGPSLYLKDYRISAESLEKARLNLLKLIEKIPIVAVDHHLLRDADWLKYLDAVMKASPNRNNRTMTMAEYAGLPNSPLEYKRAELYKEQPPPEDFIAWLKKSREIRRLEPPPLE